MNVQLVNSLVEVILTLPPEDQKLFHEILNQSYSSQKKSKPLTKEERLLLWKEWIDKAPKSQANLPNEALRRDNIYDDRGQ